ncbi:MAG: hypothetical protein IPM79_19565 [Polyangiaceae bacterium]|nr:hypothetical protein [Polyangiaceae bacterium]MBK8939752.1 hypothetical protein [Polyangiaceae bacterium]
MRCLRRLGPQAAALAMLAPRGASAEEPIIAGEPVLMREPGEVVDVADAVDDPDPFDIEIVLSYRLDVERAKLVRGDGASAVDLATVSSLTSRLVPELRVGAFRDVAVVLRLPIILSQTRDLAATGDAKVGSVDAAGETLFSLPLRSPERSGIEHLSFGVDVGILNQARSPHLPSLTAGVEGFVSVGPTLLACNDVPVEGQVKCASPGDVDRDGAIDDDEPDGGPEADPGITRGTAGLRLRATLSRRVLYVEPFGTLRATLEFPLAGSPLAASGAGPSLLPVRAEAEVGVGFIPWENRERWSRVWLDARVLGGVATRGRDYSPLFDALGSSSAPSLRAPIEAGGARGYESGVTVVGARGSLGGAGSFVWRASQLIRLGLETALRHEFEHTVTDDEPCAEDAPGCDPPTNRDYRAVLDEPSGRMKMTSSLLFQIGVSGAVLF